MASPSVDADSTSLSNNSNSNYHSTTITTTTTTSTHRKQNNQSSAGTTHAKSLLEAKVVILGTQGVGKTSLVHRYTSGHFNASSIPSTIGASFLTKKLLVGGTKVRLQIWDTAGQERFRSMAPMYYRGSNAAIIVYDITSMTSFLDVKTWLEELKKNMNSDLIIHIVGSKSDLNLDREVDLSEAKKIIRSWVGNDLRFEGDEEENEEEEMQETKVGKSEILDSDRKRNQQEGRGSISSKLNLFGNNNNNESVDSSTFTGRISPASNLNRGGNSRFTNTISSSLTSTLKDSSKDKKKGLSTSPSSSNNSSSNSSSENALNRTVRINSRSSSASSSFNSIQISEVSAKDDEGIEDVFLNLTSKLVERKLEIEKERRRRDRESIMIDSNLEDDGNAGRTRDGDGESGGKDKSNGWSCC